MQCFNANVNSCMHNLHNISRNGHFLTPVATKLRPTSVHDFIISGKADFADILFLGVSTF